MNNKGQVLVFFVLLIPIFLIFLVIIIDIGNNLSEKRKLNNICNLVVNYKEEEIEKYIKLNDDKIEIVKMEDGSLTLRKKNNAILSHIINIDKYDLVVSCISESE